MRDMIYFPGFEVRNESWLKFALLYFDTLRPIFPDTWHSRAIPLGDASRTVMGETDLIRPYHASPEEGHRAAILACGEFEKILSHPQLYRPYFRGASHGGSIEHWREPAFQNSTLFEGKYSPEFFKFCIEQRIATPCEVGIHISSDLTFVYMSLLANVISRQNNYEMITDAAKYSHYLNDRELALCKTSNLVFETAKSSIELALPADLRSIPLERFVQLRKDKSFSAARRAYLAQIEKMVARQEQGDYSDFEELVSCKREFRKICEQLFELSAAFRTVSSSCHQRLQPLRTCSRISGASSVGSRLRRCRSVHGKKAVLGASAAYKRLSGKTTGAAVRRAAQDAPSTAPQKPS